MFARRFSVLTVLLLALLALVGAASAASVTISGTLNTSNPSDEFIIFMEAGDIVTLRLNCDQSTPLDPFVGISGNGDSDGDDDGGQTSCQGGASSELSFTAGAGGTFTILVSSFDIQLDSDPTDENAYGGYTLYITGDFQFLGAGDAHLDDRVNNTRDIDTAAPVAIYIDPLEVFSINPETGEGFQVIALSDEDVEAAGIPDGGNVILAEAVSPFTGHAIILSRLSSGDFQINTVYTDGKDYIVAWDEDGMVYNIAW